MQVADVDLRRLYVETSAWGMFAPGQPMEMRRSTERMLKQARPGELWISPLVFRELRHASPQARGQIAKVLREVWPGWLPVPDACHALAEAYLAAKILPAKKHFDALHVALATIQRMDGLVSWNCRHLANMKKVALYHAINQDRGYEVTPLILTPYEVLHGKKAKKAKK